MSCKERIPRAISEEDYVELWKMLEGSDVATKRVYTPLEKRVYRLYISARYRIESYTDPLHGEIKKGIVSLFFIILF